MTAEERSLLEELDTIVGSEEIRAQIYPIVERVRAELMGNENFECELRNAARLIRKPGTAGNKLKRPETGKGQRIVSQLLPHRA